MNWLTLPEIKAQLRIEHAIEDALLEQMARAAEDYVSQFLNRPVPWHDCEGNPVEVPASVRQAALMIASDLYYNRDGQQLGEALHVNEAVRNLLHFYRVGLGV